MLRHSSYLGLREDKKPEAVVIEIEAPVGDLTVPNAKSTVTISNRERVIFPEGKLTKGQLADNYEAVAEIMLPWTGSRPISLVRCPQGRDKKCFFQKHDAGSFGDEVKHVAIREKDGHDEPYLFVDTPAGLLTCVQMGTIEFHGWGARIEDVERPTGWFLISTPMKDLGSRMSSRPLSMCAISSPRWGLPHSPWSPAARGFM